MNDEQQNSVWSAWIDETKKTITIKESPNAKQVFFERRENGMNAVTTEENLHFAAILQRFIGANN